MTVIRAPFPPLTPPPPNTPLVPIKVLAFLVGRYLLRDLVVTGLHTRYRSFAAVDAALERDGWKLVVLLRLSPVLPWNVLNYALAVTGVELLPYAAASSISVTTGPPPTVLPQLHCLNCPPATALPHLPCANCTTANGVPQLLCFSCSIHLCNANCSAPTVHSK